MFQLGKTIVSEDIIEKEFVCNLASCKGACFHKAIVNLNHRLEQFTVKRYAEPSNS